ncbi:MAG: FAD-dependent oxidoreductase, partial [Chitinophagales bacterium]|nr:FAD-dependent oxidoreductase [Hyphomicrobiales bacterium]
MARTPQPSIAVIGAGIAGLACARFLADNAVGVTVFEKSRGLGGRLATRRIGAFQFDHGAQYVTARSDGFRTYLDTCVATGAAAPWTPVAQTRAAANWVVGAPGMSALARPLAGGLDVVHGAEITAIVRDGQVYALRASNEARYGMFDGVVVTAPAPQALALLALVDAAFNAIDQVRMSPCWSALVAFDCASGMDADVLREPSTSIAWAARDCSKPGRPRGHETWVIHASPMWSREHLEMEKGEIADLLAREFLALSPERLKPSPVYIDAHRWRYALVETPLGRPFLRG